MLYTCGSISHYSGTPANFLHILPSQLVGDLLQVKVSLSKSSIFLSTASALDELTMRSLWRSYLSWLMPCSPLQPPKSTYPELGKHLGVDTYKAWVPEYTLRWYTLPSLLHSFQLWAMRNEMTYLWSHSKQKGGTVNTCPEMHKNELFESCMVGNMFGSFSKIKNYPEKLETDFSRHPPVLKTGL